MRELVSVADENGRIVGSAFRDEIKGKGLIACIAATIVFNTKGNIILQKIARTKDGDPLKWAYSSGGHVSAGEDYETAAVRELKEELGIDGKIDSFIGQTSTVRKQTGKTGSFHFVYKVIHDGPYFPDPAEAEEIREFTPEELSSLMRGHPERFKKSALHILKTLQL